MPRIHLSLSSSPSLAVFLLCLALALAVSAPPAEGEERDPKAVEVAQRAAAAMGDDEAWSRARHLRFEFFGARLHHWDRFEGRHRLEGTTREGQDYVVLQDLDERRGRVWLDGEEVDGEEATSWIERGYGAWINDVYWLLMPRKMLDPGVHLAWEATEVLDGVEHDRIRLWFDEVGLTPGDRYWAWVPSDGGPMRRWAYHLQDWEAEREPTAWDWLEWQEVGGVVLSPSRVPVADGDERRLDRLGVFPELPDAAYADPDWSTPGS